MESKKYYIELLKKAFRKPFAIAAGLAFFLALGGGITAQWWPQLEVSMFFYWAIPLAVLLILVLFGFLVAPYSIHKETVIKEISDYLRYDPEARLDRVHRLLYHLYRDGELAKNSSPKRISEWDEEVRKIFIDYCIPEVLNIYLLNSGRASIMKPLEMRQHEVAMDYIKELLDHDYNLKNRIKSI